MTDTTSDDDRRPDEPDTDNQSTTTVVHSHRQNANGGSEHDHEQNQEHNTEHRDDTHKAAFDAYRDDLIRTIDNIIGHATGDLRKQLAEQEATVEQLKRDTQRQSRQIDYLTSALDGDITIDGIEETRSQAQSRDARTTDRDQRDHDRAHERTRPRRRGEPDPTTHPAKTMVWHGHRQHNCVLVDAVEHGLGVLGIAQKNNVHDRAHAILTHLGEWGESYHNDDTDTDAHTSNWEIRISNPTAKHRLERARDEDLRSTQVKRAFQTIVSWAADDGCPDTPRIEKNEDGRIELVVPNVPPYAAGPPRNRKPY